MDSTDHPTILVTGGAGYIASHFLELIDDQFKIVVADNLSAGHIETIETVNKIRNKKNLSQIIFKKIDLCHKDDLKTLFAQYRPSAVIHYAAKISVAESVLNPSLYFKNNVEGSENLLSLMKEFDCKKLVFSSTAAVYSEKNDHLKLVESDLLGPVNPYGDTKLKIEEAIQTAVNQWGLKAIIFRYFNASGASHSGLIGEWHEPETHLIPLILQNVLKNKAELKIFGTDYETRDGTCIRDYIHVSDLAQAHILGLNRLFKLEPNQKGLEVYNLGTENGITVREVIEAAKKVTGKQIQVTECPRRKGDSAVLIASSSRAKEILGWNPKHSEIETIIRTAYVWHKELDRHSPKI